SVQLWKQDSPAAHAPSLRQFSVSMQQLLTMHWLHGVPPGSRGQVPASIAMPQCPLSQVRPTQQSWGTEQVDPGGRQLTDPHLPPWQLMLQHSEGEAQGMPSSLHELIPQSPPWQTPLQHWLGAPQGWLSGVQ